MNNVWKKVTASVLAAGLALACGGCGGNGLKEVVPTAPRPTVKKAPAEPVCVSGGPVSPHLLELNNLSVAPVYPEMPQCPQQEDYPDSSQYYDDLWAWEQSRREALVEAPQNAHDLDPFMEAAMKQFLSGPDNPVCAPLNIYFALALLAESTGGNSRQQVLNLLDHRTIEELREQANQLWRAHYLNDGETTSLMANSVWLDQDYAFKEDALSILGSDYYASVFNGDLGSQAMNKQLAQWLNSQTGGLLTEYTNGIELDPYTAFCLASTAYFCAGWEDSFSESRTQQKVFHGTQQDITTDFMHQSMSYETYYEGDNFSAIALDLTGDHRMWLILPDEGSSPKTLLDQGDYYRLISNPDSWGQTQTLTVNLSMPKFDVSGQQKLIPGLKDMGITDAFSPAQADFRSITDHQVYVGDVTHAARVVVDEEGVLAAAYTMMAVCGSCAPSEEPKEIDFILDRPFLFAVTGSDDLPVFAGIVNEP